MGTRRGTHKCRGDVGQVLVFSSQLEESEIEEEVASLSVKYKMRTPDPRVTLKEKISKNLLVRRFRSMQQQPNSAKPVCPNARLDIPKWLERYGLCFHLVDTIAQGLPLPRWFRAEIEPPSRLEPPSHQASRQTYSSSVDNTASSSSPTLASLLPPPAPPEAAAAATAGGVPPVLSHGPRMLQTVEALFDRNRCGSNATLDVQRTRVVFEGMATVLLTSPIPAEGVHVMQFEIHGRDQCLVGIASADCDVETYLGHRRGGYGFFAAEGTLKVDGDWKGGHGLAKFKRGDRVGVHVDMSRRTLQFSISRSVTEGTSESTSQSTPDTPQAPAASAAAASGASSGVDSGASSPYVNNGPSAAAATAAATTSPNVPSSPSHGSRRWVTTMLERIVEGLPSRVHFACGGAAGGELSIAG